MKTHQHIAWPTAVAAAMPTMRRTIGNDNNALAGMAGAIPAVDGKTTGDKLAAALATMDRAIAQLEEVMNRRQTHPNT